MRFLEVTQWEARLGKEIKSFDKNDVHALVPTIVIPIGMKPIGSL